MNDDEWKHSVDDRLVSLTSAQKSTDGELDDIQIELKGINETINGDPRERDGGLIGQMNRMETGLNSVRNVLDPIIDIEREKDYKWKILNSAVVSVGSIVVAIITVIGSLILNWDKISLYLKKKDPLEMKIDQAKRPRSKRKISRYRQVSTPDPGTNPNVPDPEKPESQ